MLKPCIQKLNMTMSNNAVAEFSCCTTSLAPLTGDLYGSVCCNSGFGAAFQTLYRDFHPAAPMSQVYDKLSSNAGSSWQHMCCAYEHLSAKGAMLGRHASSNVLSGWYLQMFVVASARSAFGLWDGATHCHHQHIICVFA